MWMGKESTRTPKSNIAAQFPLWTSELWKSELLGPPESIPESHLGAMLWGSGEDG